MRAASLAGVALLLACRGQPEDLFFWVGEVRDSVGAPQPGHPISLLRSRERDCHVVLGNPYSPRYPNPTMDPYRDTVSDESGRFLFELMRFEIDLTVTYGSRCFEVRASSGEASTSLHFQATARDLPLRPVVLWADGAPSVVEDEASVTLTRPPSFPLGGELRPGMLYDWREVVPTEPIERYADWVVENEAGLVWREVATEVPLTLPRYVLEDFAPAETWLELLERSYPFPENLATGNAGGMFALQASGPRRGLSPGSSVPVSRGAQCRINGLPVSRCPATDGAIDLVQLSDGQGGIAGVPDGTVVFELELPEPAEVGTIVLRDVGLSWRRDPLRIEVSADQLEWTVAAELPAEPRALADYEIVARPVYETGLFVALPLNVSGPIRYLRLRGGEFLELVSVREISLFP
jgi:hypothetical protein